MFSGEVMPIDHLRTWMDHLPEAVFVNLYGPTEVTCNCLYHIIDRDRAYDEGIPLGVAFPNRQVLPCWRGWFPLGDLEPATGDPRARRVARLGICGRRGAHGGSVHPEPLASPFSRSRLPHGRFGRLQRRGGAPPRPQQDNQIKHQGHQSWRKWIWPEAVPGVTRCRCRLRQGEEAPIAFYEGTAEAAALRGPRLEALPPFTMPTKILPIEAMPLTKNGKVDRAALLALSREAAARRRARTKKREKDL